MTSLWRMMNSQWWWPACGEWWQACDEDQPVENDGQPVIFSSSRTPPHTWRPALETYVAVCWSWFTDPYSLSCMLVGCGHISFLSMRRLWQSWSTCSTVSSASSQLYVGDGERRNFLCSDVLFCYSFVISWLFNHYYVNAYTKKIENAIFTFGISQNNLNFKEYLGL